MPTVFVVDDSVTDRRLVCELLRRQSDWRIEQAATGTEAMARMKDVAPDLVVTDLVMPQMDGLQLVTAMREHHPGVPVILMTAYGSERLALEALDRGAASYVPKSQIAFKLLGTMEEVLARARADRGHEQLLRSVGRAEFTFFLENDPALIDPLVDFVQEMVAGMGLCDFAGQMQIGLALREALLNALFHGNLEIDLEATRKVWDRLLEETDVSLVEERRSQPPYRDRRLLVDVRITPDEARFIVQDEGPGFDITVVPERSDPRAIEPEGGRGLALMQAFMDEVTYNSTGNEVTLVKRRDNDRKKVDGTDS
jgi:CheY-like chemotaxis protein